MLIRSRGETVVQGWGKEGEQTDEQRGRVGGLIALEVGPFVEDQDDQIEEDAHQEQQLGQEFQEDAVIVTEVSEQSRERGDGEREVREKGVRTGD